MSSKYGHCKSGEDTANISVNYKGDICKLNLNNVNYVMITPLSMIVVIIFVASES